ncbi:hypothetical protein B5S33_g4600 [[Candida] boidinii]|nr:hypothetical protein B5S30_g5190 [[Candida] boidinii]OWB85924.1 hypothetical protein B5S33_g4600 [[Candida] boidinii]
MSMSSEIAGVIEEADDINNYQNNSKVPLSTINSNNNNISNHDITLYQRMISACTGSLLTSLVVTPFDVVRIRLQQQQLLFPAHLQKGDQCCRVPFWEEPSAAKLNCADSSVDNSSQKNTINSLTNKKTSDFIKSSSAPSVSASSTTSTATPTTMTNEFCISNSCVKESKLTGTFNGLVKISQNEGFPTLYRGLSLTLLMAIPSNIVYFSGYEYLRDASFLNDYKVINPLLCGSIARIIAATSVAPLELLKTRLQAVPSNSPIHSSQLFKMVLNNAKSEINKNGILTIFKGLQLTLWRDVPFSGIYWSCYEFFSKNFLLNFEYFKNNTLPQQQKTQDPLSSSNLKVFLNSFISGSLSGLAAALATNPFDVGKTRLQVTNNLKDLHSSSSSTPTPLSSSSSSSSVSSINSKSKKKLSMFRFMYDIFRNEGFMALYSGIVPRCLKIAPSCAIMISTYEVSKIIFSQSSHQHL